MKYSAIHYWIFFFEKRKIICAWHRIKLNILPGLSLCNVEYTSFIELKLFDEVSTFLHKFSCRCKKQSFIKTFPVENKTEMVQSQIFLKFNSYFWIPLFSWTRWCNFHNFLEKSASSAGAVNIHFFRGIQKSFPRKWGTTTTTNKLFQRPRQQRLAVKKINSMTLLAVHM